MKRRNFLLSLSAATLAPCIPAAKPSIWKGLVGKWSPNNVARPEDAPFVQIKFNDLYEQITHKDLIFMLGGIQGYQSTMNVYIRDSGHHWCPIPLSKKEWEPNRFVEEVKRNYPRSGYEFFEITYRDLSNIWARITPRDSKGGSHGE